jgi:hypothetical protein
MDADRRCGLLGLTRLSGLIAFVVVLTMGSVDNAAAAPFTSYFDDLIVELEAISAKLEGTTDKAEKKQKKAADKVLKAFAKDSTDLKKDLKNAAKAAKTLAKAFPEDFAPDKDGSDGDTLSDLVSPPRWPTSAGTFRRC